MKKEVNSFAIAIIIVGALLVSAVIWFKYLNDNQHSIYPKSTIVVESKGDSVTVADFNGNIWQFAEESNDWDKGDICALLMDDNGTENCISDDVIMQAQYGGHIR